MNAGPSAKLRYDYVVLVLQVEPTATALRPDSTDSIIREPPQSAASDHRLAPRVIDACRPLKTWYINWRYAGLPGP